jgi:hypothetical protein
MPSGLGFGADRENRGTDMMISSQMDGRPGQGGGVSGEGGYGRGYGRGHRWGYGRRGPFVPFWLVIPLVFLLVRAPFFWGYGWTMSGGAIVPWGLALIPLAVLAILALRLLGPTVDSLGRALSQRFQRRSAEVGLGDGAMRQMELELVEARRQIRELEEKVAWQGKLLDAARD